MVLHDDQGILLARAEQRLSRRALLTRISAFGAAGSLTLMPSIAMGRAGPVSLEARPVSQQIHPSLPDARLWTYNGALPGTSIVVDQGGSLDIRFRNRLDTATSVHWHGIRTPNGMDGVPHVTQSPVQPGQDFTYRFRAEDAGTFFYHPNLDSVRQMSKGLFGPLIVREAKPYPVDRDIVWMLNDWRVERNGRLSDAFDHPHDMSHAGRWGNLVTVNGQYQPKLVAKARERIRLRLINAATARIFQPSMADITTWVVAIDGHPVTPRRAQTNDLQIGPGMRIDLVLDVPTGSSKQIKITDRFDEESLYELATIEVSGSMPGRSRALPAPPRLPDNPVERVIPSKAKQLTLQMAGGAMGGMMQHGRMMMRRHMPMMMSRRLLWIMNDRLIPPPGKGQSSAPMFRLNRGQHYVMRLENLTAFPHPMHLHGHVFEVLAINGKRLKEPLIRDTVLLDRRDRIDIGFVADNPGKWLLHCHILSHATSGMGGIIEVS